MQNSLPDLATLPPARFRVPEVLEAVVRASRALGELKGIVASIPNQGLLIQALALQEAKDSSAIENIITSHDDLYREAATPDGGGSPSEKEVLRYRQALRAGYQRVTATGLLTNATILEVQAVLERNNAGFRRLPGTVLRDGQGRVVYTPPQDAREVARLMGGLERFLNAAPAYGADPLVRMALAHHQFESIHPFYDGNGRTGRIVNVLYLVKEGLLDVPVLYLSRHIVRTKARYYRLLQQVRDNDAWEAWVCYLLDGVEATAREGMALVAAIRGAYAEVRRDIRTRHRFKARELVDNLFAHPHTRVRFVERDLGVTRLTATRYLDALAADGILEKRRAGRTNLYVNVRLMAVLTSLPDASPPRR